LDLPEIEWINPISGPAAGGTWVVIDGYHFTGVTGVNFGDNNATGIVFVNDHNVTAFSPAGTGLVDVRVITPAGWSPVARGCMPREGPNTYYLSSETQVQNSIGWCDDDNDTFMYSGLPGPTVNSIVTSNPTNGCMLGGNTVTITGTGFTGADYVMFGSTPNATGAMTVDSDTQITVTSPPGSGTVDVTVHTPSGTSALNPPADQFTYILAPTVTSVTPPNGPYPDGGNTVVITGTHFDGANYVMFGSTPNATGAMTVDSDTQITVTSPPGSGTVEVTVTTCSGTSVLNPPADQFTYYRDLLTPVMGDWTGQGNDTVGVYSKNWGSFFLRNTNDWGYADNIFQFGPVDYPGDIVPLVGNWTGASSIDTAGVYQKSTGTFFMTNSNSAGPANNIFQFGPISSSGDLVPLVGDWTGSGKDTIGLYQNSTGTFFLKNDNSAGPADNIFQFGPISNGDIIPIVGDWTGKGYDSVGVYQESTGTFFLKNSNSAGPEDFNIQYGPISSGDIVPIAGDWTNKGFDTIGIFQRSQAWFFLKNTNTGGFADIYYPYSWVVGP
jgi:hypothetical protein